MVTCRGVKQEALSKRAGEVDGAECDEQWLFALSLIGVAERGQPDGVPAFLHTEPDWPIAGCAERVADQDGPALVE